jgi:outer membrane receptor protein involved in Fe transport
VVVTSNGEEAPHGQPDGGTFLSGAELRRDATLGDDVNRALARQPGAAAGDLSARLFLRGGESNEFAILLDGMPIRNPFHLRGLQSPSGIIDATTLAGAELSAGNFPVEFGNTLSGMVSLTSLAPSDAPRYALSSSSMSTRLLASGQFDAAEGGWMVSARTWYPNIATDFVAPAMQDVYPTFQDLFGKIQRRMGDSTVMTADVLLSADESHFSQAAVQADELHSTSRYAWLDFKSVLTPRLLSETLLSSTGIDSERDGRLGPESSPEATLHDQRSYSALGIRQDWSFEATDRHLLRGGVSLEHGTAQYDSVSQPAFPGAEFGQVSGAPAAPVSLNASPSGESFGAYVADRFKPAPPLTLDLGLRWDRQTWAAGPPISPRVNVLWQALPQTALRAGWGRFTQAQGLDELRVEDGVRGFDPAESAQHWSVGFDQAFRGGLFFRLDAYRKTMSDLRPRDENLFNQAELFPEIAPDRVVITPSRGDAHGVEMSLARQPARGFGWWGSYAHASVQDLIGGTWVARPWDQRDTFNFGMDWRQGKAWDLTLASVYHTGWPTTGVTGVVVTNPDGTQSLQPVVGTLNSERLPDYLRLDLKVRKSFAVGQGRMGLFASVTNLTNRDNVCCARGFSFAPGAGGTVEVNREDASWLGRTPVFGLEWESGP